MGLRALVGMVLPIRLTGALFLRDCLRKLRPGQPDLPSAAIDEFVSVAVSVAALRGFKGIHLKSEVVEWLERDAQTISDLLAGGSAPVEDFGSHWVKILQKHRLLT